MKNFKNCRVSIYQFAVWLKMPYSKDIFEDWAHSRLENLLSVTCPEKPRLKFEEEDLFKEEDLFNVEKFLEKNGYGWYVADSDNTWWEFAPPSTEVLVKALKKYMFPEVGNMLFLNGWKDDDSLCGIKYINATPFAQGERWRTIGKLKRKCHYFD